MDPSFISTLTLEELQKLGPSIFQTLQTIIAEQNEKLEKYYQLLNSEVIKEITDLNYSIHNSRLIDLFQNLHQALNTDKIIVEIDGRDEKYMSTSLEQLPDLLRVDITECNISTSGTYITIRPPQNVPNDIGWSICSVVINEMTKDYFNHIKPDLFD